MSLPRVEYTKDWKNPSDFPTIETSETQVRTDIQDLYDQVKTDVNNIASVLESNAGAENIGASGLNGANVQEVLENLEDGQGSIVGDLNSLVKNVTYNSLNGNFTITWFDNRTSVIETELEKVVVNFEYDQETQSLILTRPDGTTTSVPLSSLIDEYDFEASDSIEFVVTNHKVKAQLTEEYYNTLENFKNLAAASANAASGYASQASGYATAAATQAGAARSSAESSATYASASASSAAAAAGSATSSANAANSAINSATLSGQKAVLSESYAKGGTNTRQGEDTDNAKYYKDEAARLIAEAGMGDMSKIYYDPENTGNKVATAQNAEKLGGLIPAAYQKAAVSVSGILYEDGWSNKSQEIEVEGVTANSTVVVSPSPTGAIAYAEAKIICTEQTQGALTFTCEEIPDSDLTVNVVVL